MFFFFSINLYHVLFFDWYVFSTVMATNSIFPIVRVSKIDVFMASLVFFRVFFISIPVYAKRTIVQTLIIRRRAQAAHAGRHLRCLDLVLENLLLLCWIRPLYRVFRNLWDPLRELIVHLKVMKKTHINICPICLRLWDIMNFL